MFAAFLGYNPVQTLLGPAVLDHVSRADAATLSGRGFFPRLIEDPFRSGLREAFAFAIVACLVAAFASWTRGTRYVDEGEKQPKAVAADGGVLSD